MPQDTTEVPWTSIDQKTTQCMAYLPTITPKLPKCIGKYTSRVSEIGKLFLPLRKSLGIRN